mmetsp:Transcript_27318/g.57684  ORF Transcript_27318/g.57684 Transcript_27318/m.57684 type:complete len:471 (-) Transcript_27318:156-1568(-)
MVCAFFRSGHSVHLRRQGFIAVAAVAVFLFYLWNKNNAKSEYVDGNNIDVTTSSLDEAIVIPWFQKYNITDIDWDPRDVCWGQHSSESATQQFHPRVEEVCPYLNADYGKELVATHLQFGKPTTGKGCVVILAQNKLHTEYGRDSRKGLMKTIERFYQHYNDRQGDDLIILHEGDFDLESQNQVIQGRAEISFLEVSGENWEVYPPSIRNDDPKKWRSHEGVGYRKMIRFFFVRIWPLLRSIGYKWVMRLDDDSFLFNDIPYNIFGFMEYYGVEYAYRNIAREDGWTGPLMYDFTKKFVLEKNDGSHGWLTETCIDPDIRRYSLFNCGQIYGFYNNFFVADIDRFLMPDVQKFIQHVDDSGYVFTQRWGDLTLSSIATMIFIDKSKFHHFVGWGYGHNSGKPTELGWGVFQIGCAANNQRLELKEALALYLNWTDGKEYRSGDLVNINGLMTLIGPRGMYPSSTMRYIIC